MQFTKRLRDPIRCGEITTSIRIWRSPRVKAGGRYRLDDGYVVVESVHEISLEDVTPTMARQSGFAGLADLLKTAKHGQGERVFYVTFHFESHGASARADDD